MKRLRGINPIAAAVDTVVMLTLNVLKIQKKVYSLFMVSLLPSACTVSDFTIAGVRIKR